MREGGNKAVDFSRRKNLAWMACANNCCDAIDTHYRNQVHNMLVEGPDPEHPLKQKMRNRPKNDTT